MGGAKYLHHALVEVFCLDLGLRPQWGDFSVLYAAISEEVFSSLAIIGRNVVEFEQFWKKRHVQKTLIDHHDERLIKRKTRELVLRH